MPLRCAVDSCWPFTRRRNLRFPRDRSLQLMWIEILNLPQLKELTASEIYKSKRICDRHFRAEDLIGQHYPGSNNRALRPGSVPFITNQDEVARDITNIAKIPGSDIVISRVSTCPSEAGTDLLPKVSAVHPVSSKRIETTQDTSLLPEREKSAKSKLDSSFKEEVTKTADQNQDLTYSSTYTECSRLENLHQNSIASKNTSSRDIYDEKLKDISKSLQQNNISTIQKTFSDIVVNSFEDSEKRNKWIAFGKSVGESLGAIKNPKIAQKMKDSIIEILIKGVNEDDD